MNVVVLDYAALNYRDDYAALNYPESSSEPSPEPGGCEPSPEPSGFAPIREHMAELGRLKVFERSTGLEVLDRAR
ncbi:MAG: hypothetical protein ACR2PY_00865, partial [Salinispira sp.]